MNKSLQKRLMRTAALCAVGLLIGIGIGWMQVGGQNAAVVKETDIPVAGVEIGGDYTLVDQDGKTVTPKDFAGRPKLIYFGFTACPAICPTELQKIMRVLKALGEAGKDIQPLFITVDPERDTVPVMHDYVRMFGPRLTGLTGSPAQVGAALKNFRIYARKVQEPGAADYTMDHSSFIYLMSPKDTLISIYRPQDSAEDMAEDIRGKLGIH